MITPPNQDFIYTNAGLAGHFESFVSFDFLIEQFTISVVAIHSDENMTAGVRYSAPAGCATESAKSLRVDDAKPGTSQHRDRQCRHHRQMERHSIAGLNRSEERRVGKECRSRWS